MLSFFFSEREQNVLSFMTAVLDSRTLLNRVFPLKSPQQLSSSLLPLLGPHLISAAGLLIVTEDLIEPNPALVSVVIYGPASTG